ncbi:hypothetical protein [Photobacterium leiognathi]|uniref:hypothetical protein n=1 Tax=Photobacterium leiognathi TaxID=553611 RepID=UPI00298116C5|nr:hypothetical protein [Photobacterium leiognathi]
MKLEPLLEFHFDYSKKRKNIGEAFHALGYYIEAYIELGQIMADAIGDDLEFEIQISSIKEGSIRVFFVKLFDEITNPSDFLRDLRGEVGTLQQLEVITNRQNLRLSEKLKSNKKYSQRVEPTINNLEVALTLEKLSQANKYMEPEETITVGDVDDNADNVVNIDTKFRFNGKPKEMFKNYVCKYDGEEYVDVIRSYYRGDNNLWRFQNRNTGFEYNAPIKDKKWLQEFRDGLHQVNPVDCLLVHSSYEIWRINGKDVVKNAKIIQVVDVKKGIEPQYDVIERD